MYTQRPNVPTEKIRLHVNTECTNFLFYATEEPQTPDPIYEHNESQTRHTILRSEDTREDVTHQITTGRKTTAVHVVSTR